MPLTDKQNKLRLVGVISEILGMEGLRELGFEIPVNCKVMVQQAVMLNRVELPFTSDVSKADETELQGITENVTGTSSEMLPMHELKGLDKQLRSIRGLLKVEVAKKAELQQCNNWKKSKLVEIRDNPKYDDGIQEDIRKQITKLNENLSVRLKSTDLLKGRLTNQIMSFKEMIAKMLDKDVSLAEKIQMLFWEQGIMITSILMAIGMAIGVLVEALLHSGSGETGSASAAGGKPPPKEEKSEWIRKKLKTLLSLQGRLGMKAAEALPGIIGVILSWIFNGAADVVGWVLQNLWALVIGGLPYMYKVTER